VSTHIAIRGLWTGLAAYVSPTSWGLGTFLYDPSYEAADSLAGRAIDELGPVTQHFLSIVMGDSDASWLPKGAPSALSLPHRFYGQESLNDLALPIRLSFHQILNESFRLGMYTHLILTSCPSRGTRSVVPDLDAMGSSFCRRAVLADRQIEVLYGAAVTFPREMGRLYYETTVRPILPHLSLGFRKRLAL